jgi:hypothetical protein
MIFIIIRLVMVVFVRLRGPTANPEAPSRPPDPYKRPPVVLDDPFLCRLIVTAEYMHETHENLLSRLASKAFPNTWLRTSFNTENAFTSSDPQVVDDFLRQVHSKIDMPQDVWQQMAILARTAALARRETCFLVAMSQMESADARPSPPPSPPAEPPLEPGTGRRTKYMDRFSINLTAFVQTLCMYVILAALFTEAEDGLGFPVSPDSEVLLQLVKGIQNAWVAFESSSPIIPFDNNPDLANSLRELFPNIDLSDPKRNPMNFILPAFEPLWKIVLRMFIEVRFRSGNDHPAWMAVLCAFTYEPTMEKFLQYPYDLSQNPAYQVTDELKGDTNVSVNSLVLEALRLFPPMPRIHRTFASQDRLHVTGDIIANISACHLDETIWGPDAKSFKPSRWDQGARITPFQTGAFMPFGAGPFTCPAKTTFGPKLIALLVGALIECFAESWTLTATEEKVSDELLSEDILRSDRNAYNGVYVSIGLKGRQRNRRRRAEVGR